MGQPLMAIEAAPDGGFRWTGRNVDLLPAIFHAVRRMPYASTGRREVAELVRTGRGACTAKHLLLAELLASVGITSHVETVVGMFGMGLPDTAPGMPDELRAMIREGGVLDYHHVVSVERDGRDLLLDATWHDAVIPLGFPVNHDWTGDRDTRLAVTGDRLRERPADLLRFKADRIGALSTADRERRRQFLALITDYVQSLE